jgi:peptide-methionine (S)-S-oxide reductase
MSARATETATLAGGCFWCLEAVFLELRGVASVQSGYTGGHVADPTYRHVCTGGTGHAEAVRVTFDPSVITYRELLDVFFTIHDPTTLNRQGADIGTQYRSAIYYHDAAQRQAAEDAIRTFTAEGTWDDPIVTEVTPAVEFYAAEEEHRDYFRRNPSKPYCQLIVAPKVLKARSKFTAKLKT